MASSKVRWTNPNIVIKTHHTEGLCCSYSPMQPATLPSWNEAALRHAALAITMQATDVPDHLYALFESFPWAF